MSERPHKRSKTEPSGYAGWEVPEAGYKLDEVNISSLTREDFFKNYVARRRPVVLNGILPDPRFSAATKWSNTYLKAKAGECGVKVERRASKKAAFHQESDWRSTRDMTFSEFLDLIEARNEFFYLKPQEKVIEKDAEGREMPSFMSPLVESLASDFPLRPKLMGKLVGSDINLWMGSSSEGSTSGLHHDFRDNLYIVLRGRKEVRLYSPAEAKHMETLGTIAKVHRNGLINYTGTYTTPDATCIYEAKKEAAEKQVIDLEAEIARLTKSHEQHDCPGTPTTEKINFLYEDLKNAQARVERRGLDEGEELPCPPPANASCSRVNLNLSQSAMQQKHPEFLQAKSAFCELHVGQMLYLPASWFHHVTSFGSAPLGHLALSYLYYPPDEPDFHTPYTTTHWQQLWAHQLLGSKSKMNNSPSSSGRSDATEIPMLEEEPSGLRRRMSLAGTKDKLTCFLKRHSISLPFKPPTTTAAVKSEKYMIEWTPDNQSTSCEICGENFSFHLRRHHCRVCGALVCAECSLDRLFIRRSKRKHYKPKRACETCAEICQMLQQQQDPRAHVYEYIPNPEHKRPRPRHSLHDPEQEVQAIRMGFEEAKRHPVHAILEKFYVIESTWYRQWMQFAQVGWDFQPLEHDKRYKATVCAPNVIPNLTLLDIVRGKLTRQPNLLQYEQIKRTGDYCLVSEQAWTVLYRYYGGGPPIWVYKHRHTEWMIEGFNAFDRSIQSKNEEEDLALEETTTSTSSDVNEVNELEEPQKKALDSKYFLDDALNADDNPVSEETLGNISAFVSALRQSRLQSLSTLSLDISCTEMDDNNGEAILCLR